VRKKQLNDLEKGGAGTNKPQKETACLSSGYQKKEESRPERADGGIKNKSVNL